MSTDDPRARVPSISRLLDHPTASRLVEAHGRQPVVAALRSVVDQVRRAATEDGSVPARDEVVAAAATRLRAEADRGTRPVVNATGIVLHTNLGRAPLGRDAAAAMAAAAGPSTVEFDLATRQRASRGRRAAGQLAALTGAEDALVVNNGAAALVLALAALSGGRQVVVSRGELVEIGGSFRLPEIVEAAGVELVEVGTTNRTRADDYRRAVDDAGDVAVLLRVHPSNFTVEGFAGRPAPTEIADVARQTGTLLVHDVGSGLLDDGLPLPPGVDEPSMRTALAEGADVVVASGDKLLGGPQAGLLVGRAEVVARCRRHPLARALRVDKLRLAALEATLAAHERDALASLPVWALLGQSSDALLRRARALVSTLGSGHEAVEVVDLDAPIGGGTLPGHRLASVGVALPGAPDAVAARLARGEPPVIGRVVDDRLVVDLRSVPPDDDARLAAALQHALA